MPWTDSHLHQFKTTDKYFIAPEFMDDAIFEDESENEERFSIHDIAPAEGDKFIYEYDFGDSWEHMIVVEKILPPNAELHLPVCIKGKMACPPEDIGGIWGYIFISGGTDRSQPPRP